MKLLAIHETEHWLKTRGLGFERAAHRGVDHQVALPVGSSSMEFLIPQRPREQLVLAHQLGRWFNCSRSLLVLTVATGFSEAEIDLFLELRRYYGQEIASDGTPGGEKPGHLFDDSDAENRRTLTEYLYLLVALNFEGYFVESDGRSLIWSGDDIMEIHTRDPQKAMELNPILDAIGVSPMKKAGE